MKILTKAELELRSNKISDLGPGRASRGITSATRRAEGNKEKNVAIDGVKVERVGGSRINPEKREIARGGGGGGSPGTQLDDDEEEEEEEERVELEEEEEEEEVARLSDSTVPAC
ncbi:hypothetical protein KM043_006004 [Ampulex compressa]|nr:hypothetical protein KM043_006004 [Ampulex compressa]